MSDAWSDEVLLARLAAARRAAAAVPRDFVEAAKTAFAWHSVDADLAELTYDSGLEAEEAALTRADSAALRALTFVAAELTIELEITEDALLGQLVPPQAGEIRIHTMSGRESAALIDDVGGFVVRATPAEPFRLHCRTHSGTSVSTSWIRL